MDGGEVSFFGQFRWGLEMEAAQWPCFQSLVTPPVMPPHPRIHTVADAGASIYLPPSRLGYVWVHYRPVTLTGQIVPAIPAICLSATPPAVGGFTLMGSSAGRNCIKSDHEV